MESGQFELLKGLIEEKFRNVNSEFSSIKTLLTDIDKNTQENTKAIIKLEERYENIKDDLNGMGIKNDDQHRQFYTKFEKLSEIVNIADLGKLKDTVEKIAELVSTADLVALKAMVEKHDTAIDTANLKDLVDQVSSLTTDRDKQKGAALVWNSVFGGAITLMGLIIAYLEFKK